MSFLDGLFQSTTEGGDPLEISDTVLTGSATITPGLMYLLHGADAACVLTVQSIPIVDIAGKRIAVKVTSPAPTTPGGDLIVAVPTGMFIEGDDGAIGMSATLAGKQEAGNYREWKCDSDGVWRLLVSESGSGGGSLAIADAVITTDQTVSPGRIYLVNSGPAPVAITLGDAIANNLVGIKLVGGSGDANPVTVAAGGALSIEAVDDSHTPQPTTDLWYEGTCAIFELDGNGSIWRLIHYTRGTGSGEGPFPRDLASAIGTPDGGYTRVDGTADRGALLVGDPMGAAAVWLAPGSEGQVLAVMPTADVAWIDPAHASTHAAGGPDELRVDGLSGELADPQKPKPHAATHAPGGADAVPTGMPVALTVGGSGAIGGAATLANAAHAHAMPGVATPTVSGFMSAADKGKLDGVASGADVTLAALAAAATNVSVNNKKIVGLAIPTAANDAANKAYVDATAQGLSVTHACRLLADSGSMNSLVPIDGVTPVAGDRVLVINQTDQRINGIYIAAASAWARAPDPISAGLYTFVTEGAVYADTGWILTTNDPITVGTSSLIFAQFSATGTIAGGNGLTRVGNTLAVGAKPDGSIVVGADDVGVGVLATDAQHGVRGGGNIHAWVTTSANGFMLAADKVKLDGLTVPVASIMSTSFEALAGNIYIVDTGGGGVTVTLPPAASSDGKQITVKRRFGPNSVVIDGNGTETIDAVQTISLTSAYEWATLICTGGVWLQIG